MKKKKFSSLSGELQTYIIDPSNYDLIEQIGIGGFAEVWLAKDRSNGKLVAYKKIRQILDERMTAAFIREITTMAQADHPFFLKLLGFSEKPPLVIISEYIPNSSLYKFRQSKSKRSMLTPTVRTQIAMGVAHAMAFLHAHGIIHRDLKSTNVLLDDNLLPKLCDFGVARFYNSLSNEPMTQSAGTPNWIAPEMQQKIQDITGVIANDTDVQNEAASLGQRINSNLASNLDGVTSGKNYVSGITQGVTNNRLLNNLYLKVQSLGRGMVNALNKSLDEHSPSKLTEETGINFVQGLINGTLDKRKEVLNSVEALGNDMANRLNMNLDELNVSSKLNNLSNSTKMIFTTPTLNIYTQGEVNIRKIADEVNKIFGSQY